MINASCTTKWPPARAAQPTSGLPRAAPEAPLQPPPHRPCLTLQRRIRPPSPVTTSPPSRPGASPLGTASGSLRSWPAHRLRPRRRSPPRPLGEMDPAPAPTPRGQLAASMSAPACPSSACTPSGGRSPLALATPHDHLERTPPLARWHPSSALACPPRSPLTSPACRYMHRTRTYDGKASCVCSYLIRIFPFASSWCGDRTGSQRGR